VWVRARERALRRWLGQRACGEGLGRLRGPCQTRSRANQAVDHVERCVHTGAGRPIVLRRQLELVEGGRPIRCGDEGEMLDRLREGVRQPRQPCRGTRTRRAGAGVRRVGSRVMLCARRIRVRASSPTPVRPTGRAIGSRRAIAARVAPWRRARGSGRSRRRAGRGRAREGGRRVARAAARPEDRRNDVGRGGCARRISRAAGTRDSVP
jgi:hypothetical protein